MANRKNKKLFNLTVIASNSEAIYINKGEKQKMCSEEEKEERIEMLATLFYWNCFNDVNKVLDWCQIKGFFNTDDCKKVIERRNYINHREDKANDTWRDVETQLDYNLRRFCNGC